MTDYNQLRKELKEKVRAVRQESDILLFHYFGAFFPYWTENVFSAECWTKEGSSFWIDEPRWVKMNPVLSLFLGVVLTLLPMVCLIISTLGFLSVVYYTCAYIFIAWIGILIANPYFGLMMVLLCCFAIHFFCCYVYDFIVTSAILNWINIVRGERGSLGLTNIFSEGTKLLFLRSDGTFDKSRFILFDDMLVEWWHFAIFLRDSGFPYKLSAVCLIVMLRYMTLLVLKSTITFIRKMTWVVFNLSVLFYLICRRPLTTFSVYFWLMKLILRVVDICCKLKSKGLVRKVKLHILSKMCIKASGIPLTHFSELKSSISGASSFEDLNIDSTELREILLKLSEMWLVFTLNVLPFLYKWKFMIDSRTYKEREKKTYKSMVTNFSMSFTSMLNEANVPAFIRTRDFSRSNIKNTLSILKDLGYPVEDCEVNDQEQLGIASGKFDSWIESGSNYITGLFARRNYTQHEFDKFRKDIKEYRRSDSYVNIDNELESVARYFNNKEVNIENFEACVEETWSLVSKIYKDSKITPLYPIYKAWNKKFNVGPFAVRAKESKFGLKRKMKRREDISRFPTIKAYLIYWEKLYSHFPSMEMIATAFYKSESLPERKWGKNKVRTPIGSMLPQYLWQMVFSNEVNHRFMPLDTPVKVGLPLTGYWLSQLYEKHSHFEKHYAGDMSDFDSTITGQVLEAVKEIRKKGFTRHVQYKTICEMIDLNYTKLQKSYLVTPSTGNVYKKGSGLTTGHASTSADNSLVTVFLYIAAWKNLTGLGADDFKNFNELSCYGDDHLLSFKSTAPKVWTFNNIQNLFKTWGITMRDEVPTVKTHGGEEIPRNPKDLDSLPFLSKFSRAPNISDISQWSELFGSNPPVRVVFHNRDALLGKMAAPVLNLNPDYRFTRIASYLDLCAHHPDVYAIGKEALLKLTVKYPTLKPKYDRLPSYKDVVQKFYSEKGNYRFQTGDQESDLIEEEGVYSYGQMGVIDYLNNYLSLIPDVLNPNTQNAGYGVSFQRALGPLLDWPKQFLKESNNLITDNQLAIVMKNTCYNFLIDVQVPVPRVNSATLLIRHWLFLLFKRGDKVLDILSWYDKASFKMNELQFTLNGRVNSKYKSYAFPVWNLILLAVLNFVKVPDIKFITSDPGDSFTLSDIIIGIKLPDWGLMASQLIGYLYRSIWLSVPPNFKDLEFLGQPESHGKMHLVQAQTGTGKSTTMIIFLSKVFRLGFRKIIVIEPRSAIVKSLVPYVKSLGGDVSGATSGMTLDQRSFVWFMTPQELLIHKEWLSDDILYVVDESHVSEISYIAVTNILKDMRYTTILCSATPSDRNKNFSDSFTEIGLPKLFTIKEKVRPLPPKAHFKRVSGIRGNPKFWLKKYGKEVLKIINENNCYEKYLIYICDKKDLTYMSNLLPGRSVLIASDLQFDVNEDCQFFLATSVADMALTIPGITQVITPNFYRHVKFIQGVGHPIFAHLDETRRVQRRGRTGRTTDGVFHLLRFEFSDSLHEAFAPDSPLDTIANWMVSGIDLEVLLISCQKIFEAVLETDNYDEINEFVERMEKIKEERIFRNLDIRDNIGVTSSLIDNMNIRMDTWAGSEGEHEYFRIHKDRLSQAYNYLFTTRGDIKEKYANEEVFEYDSMSEHMESGGDESSLDASNVMSDMDDLSRLLYEQTAT